ncbi:MAG: hypothetical protein AAF449_25580 [Myxococcota bacterium]
MSDQPDLTIVELHRVDGPLVVQAVNGDVWHFPDGRPGPLAVEIGGAIQVGDTLALGPEARVLVGTLALSGGRRGRAHALVPNDAFKSAPRRDDVPRLLEQLAGIEAEAVKLGETRWRCSADRRRCTKEQSRPSLLASISPCL